MRASCWLLSTTPMLCSPPIHYPPFLLILHPNIHWPPAGRCPARTARTSGKRYPACSLAKLALRATRVVAAGGQMRGGGCVSSWPEVSLRIHWFD